MNKIHLEKIFLDYINLGKNQKLRDILRKSSEIKRNIYGKDDYVNDVQQVIYIYIRSQVLMKLNMNTSIQGQNS